MAVSGISSQGGDNYLFNAMWALTLTVVCWLRHVCKGKKVPQVRLICLCNAGKHRSVLSSRMLYFVLQLLYDLLAGDPAAKVYLAVGRGAASASGAERSSSMPQQQGGESLLPTGGPGGVARPTDVPWRPSSAHLHSVQLLDKDLRETSTTVSAGYSDICLDTRKFIQAAAAERGTPLRKAWLADWLEGAGLAALAAQGRAVLQQASRARMARHWRPIMPLCSKLSRSAVACAPVPFSSARLGTRLQRNTSTSFLLEMVRLF